MENLNLLEKESEDDFKQQQEDFIQDQIYELQKKIYVQETLIENYRKNRPKISFLPYNTNITRDQLRRRQKIANKQTLEQNKFFEKLKKDADIKKFEEIQKVKEKLKNYNIFIIKYDDDEIIKNLNQELKYYKDHELFNEEIDNSKKYNIIKKIIEIEKNIRDHMNFLREKEKEKRDKRKIARKVTNN